MQKSAFITEIAIGCAYAGQRKPHIFPFYLSINSVAVFFVVSFCVFIFFFSFLICARQMVAGPLIKYSEKKWVSHAKTTRATIEGKRNYDIYLRLANWNRSAGSRRLRIIEFIAQSEHHRWPIVCQSVACFWSLDGSRAHTNRRLTNLVLGSVFVTEWYRCRFICFSSSFSKQKLLFVAQRFNCITTMIILIFISGGQRKMNM